MKIGFKTKLWESRDTEYLKERILGLMWRYAVLFLIIFAYFIYQQSYILAFMALLPIIAWITGTLAYKKYKKEILK